MLFFRQCFEKAAGVIHVYLLGQKFGMGVNFNQVIFWGLQLCCTIKIQLGHWQKFVKI